MKVGSKFTVNENYFKDISSTEREEVEGETFVIIKINPSYPYPIMAIKESDSTKFAEEFLFHWYELDLVEEAPEYIYSLWIEWDFGQDNLAFTTEEAAIAWFNNNEHVKEMYSKEECICVDDTPWHLYAIEEGLAQLNLIQLIN